VDANWDGPIPNRDVDQGATNALLRVFHENGLDRIEPSHHMAVSIDQQHVATLLKALNLTSKYDLIKLNDDASYPLLSIKAVQKFKLPRFSLLAGQHRFKALKMSIEDQTEWWWVARVYCGPLPIDASSHLKLNKKTVQTELSEGDQFLTLLKWEEEIKTRSANKAQCTPDELYKLERMERQFLKDKGLWAAADTRAKQVMERIGFRKALSKAFQISGIRVSAKFGSLDMVLRVRYMGVLYSSRKVLTCSSWTNCWRLCRTTGSPFSSTGPCA